MLIIPHGIHMEIRMEDTDRNIQTDFRHKVGLVPDTAIKQISSKTSHRNFLISHYKLKLCLQ